MICSEGEALLLDWLLCGQGNPASEATLDQLHPFQDLRERIWRAIVFAQLARSQEIVLDLEDADRVRLLALVPTTFRWGTGDDVGYSLKTKLAEDLWRDEEGEKYERIESLRKKFGGKDDSASTDQATPNASADKPATWSDADG